MDLKLKKPSKKLILPAISIIAIALSISLQFLANPPERQSVKVLISTHDLIAGSPVSQKDFEVIEMPVSSDLYLTRLTGTKFLEFNIRKGQLVPTQAITSEGDGRVMVRLNNLAGLLSEIRVGDQVDIWAMPGQLQEVSNVQVVAFEAIVSKIEEITSLGQLQVNVELRIPADYLEPVMQAKAGGMQFDIVLSNRELNIP